MHIGSYALALACISFEMDQISFRIPLQKGPISNAKKFAKYRPRPSYAVHHLTTISSLTSLLESWLANMRRSVTFVRAEANTQMGLCCRSGASEISSGSPKGFAAAASSACGNSSFEKNSQGTEDRANLGRSQLFHSHSGISIWLVPLLMKDSLRALSASWPFDT